MEFDVAKLMETALNEMENGQYADAANHFSLVVIHDPYNIDAPFFRAYCKCYGIVLGEVKKATEDFSNTFCHYIDIIKRLDGKIAKEKAEMAVKLLTKLVNTYTSNATTSLVLSPIVGFSVSNSTKKMNDICMDKIKLSGIMVSSEEVWSNKKAKNKFSNMIIAIITTFVLAIIIAIICLSL